MLKLYSFKYGEIYDLDNIVYSTDAWLSTENLIPLILMSLIVIASFLAYSKSTKTFVISIALIVLMSIISVFSSFANSTSDTIETTLNERESIVEMMAEKDLNSFMIVKSKDDVVEKDNVLVLTKDEVRSFSE